MLPSSTALKLMEEGLHFFSLIERRNSGIPENDFATYHKSLNPLGRYGTPHEIAAAVAFLASPDASFIPALKSSPP